ncbi:MAG: BON domain-containing protein [Syntrophaceae bacterium]
MRKTVILLLVVLFALTACSSTTGRTAGQNVDDTVIKSEINGKILADPNLKFFQIDVASFNGNVTLSGQVPNRDAETKLLNIARNTKGVKSVKSNLQIKQQ